MSFLLKRLKRKSMISIRMQSLMTCRWWDMPIVQFKRHPPPLRHPINILLFTLKYVILLQLIMIKYPHQFSRGLLEVVSMMEGTDVNHREHVLFPVLIQYQIGIIQKNIHFMKRLLKVKFFWEWRHFVFNQKR